MAEMFGRFNGVFIDLSHPVVCYDPTSTEQYYVMPHTDDKYGEHKGGFIDMDAYGLPIIIDERQKAHEELSSVWDNFLLILATELRIWSLLSFLESLIRKVQKSTSNLKSMLTNILRRWLR